MNDLVKIPATIFTTAILMVWFMAYIVEHLFNHSEWWGFPLFITMIFAFVGVIGPSVYKFFGLFDGKK